MTEVIGIKFKNVGKTYFFAPNNIAFSVGEHAIVETARGIECGEVSMANTQVDDEKVVKPLKSVIRKATENDMKTVEENHIKEQEAFKICEEKIKNHKLDMNLVDVEYTFDRGKILFYFTAETRIDFRELVKDLAGVFRTRIELRQIGVRDEAKMLGGLGICGRPFCCSKFLGDFQPVTIKMAKDQGLSLNQVKISGTCGRLMCCLKYEQNAYDDLLKITPRQGALVDTPQGKGTVVDVDLLRGKLKVNLSDNEDATPIVVKREDVKVLRNGKAKVEKIENEDELKNLED